MAARGMIVGDREGTLRSGGRCVRRLGRAAAISLLLLLPLSGVRAAGMDEALFFGELPQVVTVTRLSQSALETPASVTIIDRRMIEASGAVDIPDLLRLAAGFQVGHPSGTRTTVTYHGMTDEFARRMQVLVDGRSVYTPLFGGVDWPLLPLSLEDIERIEVTRGPNGVTHGANSFLGVINIITRHPSAVESSYAKLMGGGDDYRKAVVRQGGRGADFDYRLTLEHRADSGLDDSSVNGANQLYDATHIDRLSFRGEYRAAVNDYLDLQLGVNGVRLGDGVANDIINPVRDTDNRAHFQQLGWRHVGSVEEETELRIYHEFTDVQNAYQTALLSAIFGVPPSAIPLVLGVPDQPVAVDVGSTSERFNIELQHRYRLAPSVRAVSGVETRLDRVRAPGLLGPDGWLESRLYRLFTNGEWRVTPAWLLNGGVMVENNDIVGPRVSPRLAVNYALNSSQALRASYTRAYRTPAMVEEYGDYAATYAVSGGVADQLLKSAGGLAPERIDAWEVALVGEHRNGVGYDLKLFQEKMSNLIVTPTDVNFPEPNCNAYWQANYPDFCRAIVSANGGTALTTGGELQFSYRPDSSRLFTLGWSHLFRREGETLRTLSGTTATYDSMEMWRPEDTLTVLGEQGLGGGVTLSGMVHHVDSWLVSGARNDVRFTTASVRMAKKFSLGAGQGAIAFTVNDLLGTYYDFVYFSPTTPKAYLGVEVVF